MLPGSIVICVLYPQKANCLQPEQLTFQQEPHSGTAVDCLHRIFLQSSRHRVDFFKGRQMKIKLRSFFALLWRVVSFLTISVMAETMYHAIVKRIAKKNFERVNERDFASLLKDCVPNVHHRFGGTHALGGERHDREALGRWLARLARLGPDMKLTVRDVWVKGRPHNTTVIVRWTNTDSLPDGSRYENHGVHIVKMRWGKIVEIDANEDSQAVAEALKMRAADGIEEAAAPPIVS